MSNAQSSEIPVAETTPSKRTRRRGCLIWFLIFAAVYYWVGCHSTPLRVSKETTYALGPMTSDGKRIDYFRAMEERYYPPEMQTDDNGCRLIVKACGVTIRPERTRYDAKTGEPYAEKIDPEPFRLQVYEKLGLDPNEKPTLKIESPYGADYLAKYDKENPTAEGEQNQRDKFLFRGKMWTFDDFPMLQDWLDDNTAGIDLLGEAVPFASLRNRRIRTSCKNSSMARQKSCRNRNWRNLPIAALILTSQTVKGMLGNRPEGTGCDILYRINK